MLNKAKPGPWRRAVKGIYFRTTPGQKNGIRLDRYYVLKHSPHGKQITEALGWESDGWSLDVAQETISRLRHAKRTGIGSKTLREEREVNERKKRQLAEEEEARRRREKTVAELWDRYSKEVVALANKASTGGQKNRMWKTRIEPAIGALKINDVAAEDASAVVRAPLRLDDNGRIVGGKGEAGNLYRLLHHMFSKAMMWGLRSRELGNPLEGVAEPKVPRRERLLSAGEKAALDHALDDPILAAQEGAQVIAIIRLAFMTGARISEILSLQWSMIRRDTLELHLPDTKTGFSPRPLAPATLQVLMSVERMPGVNFVFRNPRHPTRPLSYSTAEKAFQRIAAAAGVRHCTLHTIRHWFVTETASRVKNPRIGMALSGHKSTSAYLGYVHSNREEAAALAEQLAELSTGPAESSPPAEVVDLRRRN
jgi:integrase